MLKPGTVVDRYVIEERIGEGGMAAVYRARHTTLGSRHALKVLTITSGDVRERLVQEGKVQASLLHPNIVTVSDVLEINGAPCLVMEYIQGPALDHWLFNYTPTLEEALTIFRGIVAGVGAAHARGILHRDLKPANILLHVDDRGVHPKVTDFGLAKLTNVTGSRNTRTGTTMGTPQYMAPEQIRDASGVDRRADLYSLGVILYELVCGEPPFKDDDVIELFTKVAAGDYRHPRDLHSALPQRVVDCIEGLMEVNTAHRFTDCTSALEVLNGADATNFTAPIVLDPSGKLPSPRPMPANPGPTTLTPDTPGAAIANRWVKPLVSVQAEPQSPPSLGIEEDDVSELNISLSKPTSLPSTPEEPKRSWTSRLLIVALLMMVALLLTTLFGTAGLLLTGWSAAPELNTSTTDVVTPDSVPPLIEAPAPPVKPAPAPTELPPSPTEQPPSVPDVAPTTDVAPVQPEVEPSPTQPKPPTVKPTVVRQKPSPPEPVTQPSGSFRVERDSGTQMVVLEGAGHRYREGESVPIGNYDIIARFEGYGESAAGSATIIEGGTITIACVKALTRCVER